MRFDADMAPEQDHATDHIDKPDHEAILTGVVALATLFSNVIEAFGLIVGPYRKERHDEILLTRLGIQQARLLIWGDAVGISSPPAAVTDRAVPKYPSAAYPDLTEPTFFGARDVRLDETEIRTKIEDALNSLADKSSTLTREQMMETYGLKPPKTTKLRSEQALDTARLEGFREKYELLLEVAESYAHLNVRRGGSITAHAWVIADPFRFSDFIKLVQEKTNFLIELMGVKDRVDRAMRVDIRGFGWHMVDDRTRTMADKLKLGLINDACKGEYPEYVVATQQALEQISREYRERAITKMPDWATNPYEKAEADAAAAALHAHDKKRPGLLGLFRSFNKPKEVRGRQASIAPAGSGEPHRSMSDAGPDTTQSEPLEDSQPIRSKSLGHILDAPGYPDMHRELAQGKADAQEAVAQAEEQPESPGLQRVDTFESQVSRHDQFKGLGRIMTRDVTE